jgi:hypothetical protein
LKANRADPKTKMSEQPVEFEERSAAEAKTSVAKANESVEVATANAKQVSAQERSVEAARQSAASVPASERSASNVPSSSASANVTSARPARAANNGNAGDAIPSSGGAAQLARSSNGQPGGAANATAQSVNVAAAGGASAPRVAESSGASAATRGSAASVPLGNAGAGTGTALSTPQSGTPSRGNTGNLARQSTGAGQPQLGQAEASKLGSGGTGRQANAVGTQAGEVNVASAAGSSTAKSGVLGTGPAKTSVGKQTTGVPARESNGTGDASGPPSSTSSSGPTALRSSTGGGLSAKSSEPSAKLDADAGFAKGSSTGLSTSRAAAPVTSSASAAEQSGTLVFSGPQAQPSGGGKLAGPQSTASVPRRSAGLPGSSGPGTSSAPTGSSSAQPTRISGGSARPGVGEGGPKLASEAQVAGLIKRAAPGIGASPEAKIAAGFSMRKTESRREAIKSLGGSEESEKAVERGLLWLAKHQDTDGHWGIHDLHCKDHQCTGHGSFQSNTAATGLGLLAFLGAGYTHQSGEHQAVVDRGLKWLVQHQKADGDLFSEETEFVWFYSHGMAAIALCEAYGLTRDPALREPAQKALNFVVASQHPQFGGWRYRPKFESDTSVSGWQLMALKSGEMAGLSVPKEVYAGVSKWLDSVESKTSKGQYAYHPSRPESLAMTAEGLLMRQYLGAVRTDARLVAGADSLRQRLPDLADRDAYYWYYATQVMFHIQGAHWDEWNSRLRDTLVSTQLKDGDPNGSWSPDRPTPEKWGAAGGRHYVTCMNLLMLEVYYRHLPLYIELGK